MAIQTSVLLLTAADVAGLLQVPEEVVLALHEEGRIRGAMLASELRFRARDIEDFVAKLSTQGGPIMQA